MIEHPQKISLTALLALLATLSTPSLVDAATFNRTVRIRQVETITLADSPQVQTKENSPGKSEFENLVNQALKYERSGELNLALSYYEKALGFARQLKNPELEMQALENLGSFYFGQDFVKAIEYYNQSLQITRQRKDELSEINQILTLIWIGQAYMYLEDFSQANSYFEQSLAIEQKVLGEESSEEEEEESEENNDESYKLPNLSIASNLTKPMILLSQGVLSFKAGNLIEAEKTLLSGIVKFESFQSGLREVQNNIVGNSLYSFLGQGHAYIRKDSFWNNAQVVLNEQYVFAYKLLQKVLVTQQKNETALEIAERGRARAFLDLLAKRLASKSKEKIQVIPPSIAQIRKIAQEQQATLVEYSIIDKKIKYPGTPTAPDAELFIWVVKPTGEVVFRRSDLSSLKTSLEEFVTSSRDSIGVRGRRISQAAIAENSASSNSNKLQQLYQILIQPIADLLPTDPSARVVFVPHESLFLVPFAALQDANGQYLIEKHTILTVPAIQVLELTRQQRQKVSGDKMLVVGNPTMPSLSLEKGQSPQPLSSLPGAEQEALAVAELFNTQAIIGGAATKKDIVEQLPKARLIHLATHGFLDDFQEESSVDFGIPGAIALAPSNKDNGLLTASEILDLKLNADLVVLSACDTGRGKITGDGVIGLSRSLIIAGVPSVIVSLWAVPDTPTATLMTEFYRNWQQNRNKATALRQAMLTTKKQYPHPKNWAAFTLIGEAESTLP